MIILKKDGEVFCATAPDTLEFLHKLTNMGAIINYRGETDGTGYFRIAAYTRDHMVVGKMWRRTTACPRYTVGDEIYYSYEDMLNSGRYFSKSNLLDCDTDEIRYAKTSNLYNKIMIDGNVFNPYIHRRFLPHQYIQLIEQYNGNIDEAIKAEYHLNYALEYTKKEVRKLSILFKIDRKTFRERCRFFNYSAIYAVVKQAADIAENCMSGKRCYYLGNQYFYGENITIFLASVKKMLSDIIAANNYGVLRNIIENNNIYDVLCKGMPSGIEICDEWKRAFKASGAYNTMKHLIMFEGYLFREGQTQLEALKELESMLPLMNAELFHDHCMTMLHSNIRIGS